MKPILLAKIYLLSKLNDNSAGPEAKQLDFVDS